MKRNMALGYEQNHSYHETPANTLLQGLQNLSDGRVFREQKTGPSFKINISFQLTLFHPALMFNCMQSAQQ